MANSTVVPVDVFLARQARRTEPGADPNGRWKEEQDRYLAQRVKEGQYRQSLKHNMVRKAVLKQAAGD